MLILLLCTSILCAPLGALTVVDFQNQALPLIRTVNQRIAGNDASLPINGGVLAIELNELVTTASTILATQTLVDATATTVRRIRDTATMQAALMMTFLDIGNIALIETNTVTTAALSASATTDAMANLATSQQSAIALDLSTLSSLKSTLAPLPSPAPESIEYEYNTTRATLESILGILPAILNVVSAYESFVMAFITAAQPTKVTSQSITNFTAIQTAAATALSAATSAQTVIQNAGTLYTLTKTGLAALITQLNRETLVAQIAVLNAQISLLQQTLLTLTPASQASTQTAINSKLTALFSLENKLRAHDIAEMIAHASNSLPSNTSDTALNQAAYYVVLYNAKITQTLQTLSLKYTGINPSSQTKQLISNAISTFLAQQLPILNLLGIITAFQNWGQVQRTAVASAGSNLTNFMTQAQALWSDFIGVYLACKGNSAISTKTVTALTTAEKTLLTTFALLPTTISAAQTGFQNIQTIGTTLLGIAQTEFNQQIATVVALAGQKFAQMSATTVDTGAISNATPAPDAVDPTIITGDNTATLTSQIFGVNTQSILLASKSTSGVAQLRDIALANSAASKTSAGIKIYIDQSAIIGLGTANLGINAASSLNILGENSTQIVPVGNGIININADIVIAANTPLIPTASFGTGSGHRILFTSAVERKITVLSGVELDLSGFSATGSNYAPYGKQIVFGGKVKLILEPGAKIRFPYMADGAEQYAPVLYFNEDSELIFLGTENRDEPRWTDALTGTNKIRNKILGVGSIWLNKKAIMSILSTALVGVEADYKSPRTSLNISLKRQAQIQIGTVDVAGGSFQIGNVVYGGDGDQNGPNNSTNRGVGFVPRATQIDFSLTSNDPACALSLYREGFLGLGVGIINKNNNPNGNALSEFESPDTENAWQLQSLHNVCNIALNFTKGSLNHNNIADGTNDAAALIGIGPLEAGGKYSLSLGQFCKARVRGGGSILFIGENAPQDAPYTASLWSTAAPLTFTDADTGIYNILAPDIIMRRRFSSTTITDPDTGETTDIISFGRGIVSVTDTSYSFTGPQEEFFMSLSMASYKDFSDKFVALGTQENIDIYAGYVNGTTIVRQLLTSALDSNGNVVSPAKGLDKGYLIGAKADIRGNPISFIVPQQ